MNPVLTRRRALALIGAAPLAVAGCRGPAGTHTPGTMTHERAPFGRLPDGREAELFVFRNARGTVLKFTNYGLTVTELHAPDREGKPGNIVLGFDNLPRYLAGHPFFGCIAGRFANRIARGRFTLDGTEYVLAANNGPNHLHGGKVGFDKKLWTGGPVRADAGAISAELSYVSPDGEEGYPGTLSVTVTYALTRDDVWRIDYRATTDKPTILNLTNHSYFNLAGAGDVLEHDLEIEADQYTEVDEGLIPTGRLLPVSGTSLDFTRPVPIGLRGMNTGLKPDGYDHNYVLRHGGRRFGLAARVLDPSSGRTLECHTDQPGVQLWTMNFDPGPDLLCTGGRRVPRHGGFCLETQHFPDAIHHPAFAGVVLRPGETFRSRTEYRLGVRGS